MSNCNYILKISLDAQSENSFAEGILIRN